MKQLSFEEWYRFAKAGAGALFYGAISAALALLAVVGVVRNLRGAIWAAAVCVVIGLLARWPYLACRRRIQAAREILNGGAGIIAESKTSAVIQGLLGFYAVVMCFIALGVMWAHVRGRAYADSLHVGMNIRQIELPALPISFAGCRAEKVPVIYDKNEWKKIRDGSLLPPGACEKMGISFMGRIPEITDLALEFDDNWNIKSKAPVKFHSL